MLHLYILIIDIHGFFSGDIHGYAYTNDWSISNYTFFKSHQMWQENEEILDKKKLLTV